MTKFLQLVCRASLIASLLAVSGCGGSGSSGSTPIIDTPTPTPPPPAPDATCAGNNLINVVAATDNGQSIANNGPGQAIDDDLNPSSRWESPGDAVTLTLDLG
ncbi:MAG: hypothetical protein AAF438_22510, partial [Pseudomonadota bacterium]